MMLMSQQAGDDHVVSPLHSGHLWAVNVNVVQVQNDSGEFGAKERTKNIKKPRRRYTP